MISSEILMRAASGRLWSAEDPMNTDESHSQGKEAQRQQAEEHREVAESNRLRAEEHPSSAEGTRRSEEKTRQYAEGDRLTAEVLRHMQESARQTAEDLRHQAEEARRGRRSSGTALSRQRKPYAKSPKGKPISSPKCSGPPKCLDRYYRGFTPPKTSGHIDQ